jgi:glycosyltransferase involved in cell wall biosynthesis
MAPKLSVVIATTNEEDCIRDCLESVKWADEIFVALDDRCNDGTEAICREYTDRVVRHEYETYALQLNWAFPHLSHPWIFVIDADEQVTPELAEHIKEVIEKDPPEYNGFEMLRLSYFLGRRIRYCGWQNEYVPRLFRQGRVQYQEKRIHAGPIVDGVVGRIEGPLLHYTYSSLAEFVDVLNDYTTRGAEDALERGKKAAWYNVTLRPILRFVRMYLFQLGFLDGKEGLLLCSLGAFSVFSKYAKLWELQRKERNRAVGD